MAADKTKMFPKGFQYGACRSWGHPLTKSMNSNDSVSLNPDDANLDLELIKKISRFPLISLNMSPFADNREDIIRKIREFNPRIKILGYSLWADAFPHNSNLFYGDMWKGLTALPNGLLYAMDGTLYTTGYRVNIGNKDTIQLLVRLWGNKAIGSHQFDGVFMDYCTTDIWWTSSNTPGNKVLDFQRAGFESLQANDIARRANFKYFMNRMKEFDYTGFLYVGNGGMPQELSDEYLNGKMFEGWPGFNGQTYDEAIQHIIDHPKPYHIIKLETNYPVNSREWSRDARFGLACSVMADCWFHLGHQVIESMSYWYDELSVKVQPGYYPCYADETGEYTGWLGEAVKPAFRTPEGLWRRDFPYGIVYLNTTRAPITVDTILNYRRIAGKSDPYTNHSGYDRHFTIPPLDGLFLVTIPRQPPPRV